MFYDVFDELRYFEAGSTINVLDINGLKVGIAICEDLWNDKDADDYRYENNHSTNIVQRMLTCWYPSILHHLCVTNLVLG